MKFKNGDKVKTVKDYACYDGRPKLGLILTVDYQENEVVTMTNRDEYHEEELELISELDQFMKHLESNVTLAHESNRQCIFDIVRLYTQFKKEMK